jgi:hypothetical protein
MLAGASAVGAVGVTVVAEAGVAVGGRQLLKGTLERYIAPINRSIANSLTARVAQAMARIEASTAGRYLKNAKNAKDALEPGPLAPTVPEAPPAGDMVSAAGTIGGIIWAMIKKGGMDDDD